jgi:protein-tyrosine-phosphatase
MLGDYAGTGEEVEDPYGLEREDYEACAGHISRLIEGVADRLEAQASERHAEPSR